MSSDRWFHGPGGGARIVGDGPTYQVKFDGRSDYETDDFDSAIADVRAYVGRAPEVTTVHVTLENGNNWVTRINTDFEGACNYFFGAGEFEQPDETVSRVASVSELGMFGQVVRVERLVLRDLGLGELGGAAPVEFTVARDKRVGLGAVGIEACREVLGERALEEGHLGAGVLTVGKEVSQGRVVHDCGHFNLAADDGGDAPAQVFLQMHRNAVLQRVGRTRGGREEDVARCQDRRDVGERQFGEEGLQGAHLDAAVAEVDSAKEGDVARHGRGEDVAGAGTVRNQNTAGEVAA